MNRLTVVLAMLLVLAVCSGLLIGWKALGWRNRLATLKEYNRDYAGIEVYPAKNAEVLAAGVRPDVVLIGASHTLDWGDTGRRLPNVRVVNRGLGGQLVPQYVLRFRQDVLELNPRVVVIEGCAIDVTYQVPIRTLTDSYTTMIELARARGIEPILATVMPVGPVLNGRIPGLNDGVRRVNDAIRETAKRLGVRLVDYYAAVADEQGMLPAEDTDDGMHCGPRVYDRMAVALAPVLAEALAPSPQHP
jgi:lysophospholipase L1-like esterase